jgi:hypothetical protein
MKSRPEAADWRVERVRRADGVSGAQRARMAMRGLLFGSDRRRERAGALQRGDDTEGEEGEEEK